MYRDQIEQMAAQLQSFAMRLAREARRADKDKPGGMVAAAASPVGLDPRPLASLGPARVSALAALASDGPLSLAELADADRVRAPTMSRLVEGLVRDGLVTRETVPTNRRTVRIAITSEGQRALAAERKRRVRSLADRLEKLGDSEQRALQRGVELLGRIVGKV
jgi:DNA-binding MarR family transcriptional regulator